MTEQEILEGNKTIARFEGAIVVFHYHDDWNQLMRVVEKIERVEKINAQIQIDKNIVMVSIRDGDILFHGNIIFDKNKLETTWLAVIEFIKWYNEQNND